MGSTIYSGLLPKGLMLYLRAFVSFSSLLLFTFLGGGEQMYSIAHLMEDIPKFQNALNQNMNSWSERMDFNSQVYLHEFLPPITIKAYLFKIN